MKRINTSHAILAGIMIVSLGLLSACNDDDNGGTTPPPAPSFPLTMTYHSIIDTELMLWVGGEAVNTSGLSASNFLDPWEWELLDESYWQGRSMIFSEDSLFGDDFSEGAPYFFSNDSVYATMAFNFGGEDIVFDQFLGMGNFSELRFQQGSARYVYTTSSSSGSSFTGGNMHMSLDDALEEFSLSALDEMGANDSLIVYNQTVIFRP